MAKKKKNPYEKSSAQMEKWLRTFLYDLGNREQEGMIYKMEQAEEDTQEICEKFIKLIFENTGPGASKPVKLARASAEKYEQINWEKQHD
jgi:hypothetical protein